MERKIYRFCLGILIVISIMAGFLYYMKYQDQRPTENGASFVENVIDEDCGDQI